MTVLNRRRRKSTSTSSYRKIVVQISKKKKKKKEKTATKKTVPQSIFKCFMFDKKIYEIMQRFVDAFAVEAVT